MAIVSVIIPIYNTKEYLNQCISSVIKQKFSDLEIILIDDGSTDGCSTVCDEWAEKDKRINVIHKENGGLSSAVKAGISSATGNFCVFADSDDWMKENLIGDLYDSMIRYHADGVRGGYTIYKGGQIVLSGIEKFRICDRETIESILTDFYEKKGNIVDTWSNSRCSKMYRTDILKTVEKMYNNEISIGEDLELNLLYLEYAQSVVLIPDNYNYCIRKHEDSMTGGFSKMLPEKYLAFSREMYRIAAMKNRPAHAVLPLLDSMFTGLIIEHLKGDAEYTIKKRNMLYLKTFYKENMTAVNGFDVKHYPIKSAIILKYWKMIYILLSLNGILKRNEKKDE